MPPLPLLRTCSKPSSLLCILSSFFSLSPTVYSEESHTQHKRSSSPPFSTTTTITDSNNCLVAEESCHFYTHCIEAHFYCGSLGFSQAYAETRCEAIHNLRHSGEQCDTCIGSASLFNWVSQQDECLRQELVNIVENEFVTMRSDPPTCLRFERKGLELMKKCARTQSDLFCSALSDPTFERDITVISNNFRIDSYYATQVERMLRDLVMSCGTEPQVSTLAQSVLSAEGVHTPRLVFCSYIHPSHTDSHEMAVQMLSTSLGRSADQFEFSGIDSESCCINCYEYPARISPSQEDQLLFITWRPEQDDALMNSLGETTEDDDEETGISAVFWEYGPLRSNDDTPECGDGRRQAGELCDMGVANTDSDQIAGCDYSCQPTEFGVSVECSTGRFETSQCWYVSCGDGVRSVGEECDDGNSRSGDGCSSSCHLEQGYKCSTSYNRTTVCYNISAITATTNYPPATTSPPSTLHSVSHDPPLSIPTTTLPSSFSSSSSSSSLLSTSSSHHDQRPSSPSIEPLSATASAGTSHHQIITLHSLVSVLVTLTLYWVTTR